MPRRLRYDRDTIINAAFNLVRRRGMEALNARAVADELHCSTQPIFRAFAGMDELRDAVILRAYACYTQAIQSSADLDEKPYKATGIAYIGFARNEPHLFRLLFMCERQMDMDASNYDESLSYVIAAIQNGTGYSAEQARAFHHMIWLFTHGLAVMVATRFIHFDDAEISRLLSEHYLATKARFDQLYIHPRA